MTGSSARETVVQEQLKRAKAQQQTNDLKAQVQRLRSDQVQAFMMKWDKDGLASVTKTPPIIGDNIGQHAWEVMTAVLADPCNKYLSTVCEDLADWDENRFTQKKDPLYLMALVNVAMMLRCKNFLTMWVQDGPKCIGLPKDRRDAETLGDAHEHIRPLVTNSEPGGFLRGIIRDLQVFDRRKLMSLPNSCYLQALTETGDSNQVQ